MQFDKEGGFLLQSKENSSRASWAGKNSTRSDQGNEREDFKILITIPGMPAETCWKFRKTDACICSEMTYAWVYDHKDCTVLFVFTLVHLYPVI